MCLAQGPQRSDVGEAICMSYREGEIDSPFSQRNQRAYCVSICEVQSRFFLYFLQEYKLFMRSLEASRETLSMNTEKASS